jgi:cytochrome P450
VLRLFPPILHLARESKDHQTLNGQSNTIFHLAPKTKIYINNAALGSNPTTWGADALQFRPSRWLTDHSTAGESPLIAMPRGTFLPWSGGPRVCPGQKMSQVEFVAVVMTLFRTCRAEPVLAGGESMETARKRLIETTQDSQPRLTLQMNRPQDVKLRWVRR